MRTCLRAQKADCWCIVREGEEKAMFRRKGPIMSPSEITPEGIWLNRRALMAGALASVPAFASIPAQARSLEHRPGPFGIDEKQTAFDDITAYNNFYEFGTG